jgi:hypothetical protein
MWQKEIKIMLHDEQNKHKNCKLPPNAESFILPFHKTRNQIVKS